MRTEAEIRADARPGRAFSNGTAFDIWASRYCYECVHDVPETETYCPILGVALISETTPREWVTAERVWTIGESSGVITEVDSCTEFTQRPEWPGDDDPDAGPPPPDPVSEVEGQLDLIDAYLDTAINELSKEPSHVR